MATKKIAPVDRAAVAKKAAAEKVEKAKKPIVNEKGQRFSRVDAAKQASKAKLKK